MASVVFALKEPNSKKETLIYLLFFYDGNRLKYSTGEKILPSNWNSTKQRAKETSKFDSHKEFNNLLFLHESAIKDIYRKFINDRIVPNNDRIVPNNDTLRDALKTFIKGDTKSQTDSLFQFIEKLIKNTSKRPNTVRNYKQTLAKLIEYKKYSKKALNFDSIDIDFYNDFTKFLNEKSLSTNTIGGFIKNIKVFMNESFDRGLHKNMNHLSRKFKVIEESTDSIYLTQDEINSIYKLDFSTNSKLDKVRDLFIIGCYTGLRFSDLEKLTNANFIANNTQIKVKTEKTGESVIVPVHRYVKEIFDKYSGEIPKTLSNQKMNEYLKEICLLAGLTQKQLIAITKGGERVTQTYKKYELVSTHTARRSFATNLFLAEVPSITIMKITGHKTEKAFLKYIRLTQEQNANKLVNHPFFQ